MLILDGVIGTLYDNCEVKLCKNSAEIKATSWSTGGIVGLYDGSDNSKIIACANLGAITSEGPNVGGVIGLMQNGTIRGCYNSGNVTGKGMDDLYTNSGGILGRGGPHIEYCYNKGTINGHNGNVGGISGKWYGDSSTNIQYCYNIGIIPVGGSAAAIVGRNDGSNVNNCVWTLGYRCIGHGNAASSNCNELTETEMKAYTNKAFVLDNEEPLLNDGYPVLYWEKGLTIEEENS